MNERGRGSAEPGSGPVEAAAGATRWWALAVVLLLVVTVLVAVRSVQASGEPQAQSVTLSETSMIGGPGVPAASPGAPAAPGDGSAGALSAGFAGAPAPAAGAPAALRIPALGMDESLITLGLNPDGTVEVPTDFSRAGWYEFGPAPGEPGSAVILGHVDSFAGPAVFHRLRELEIDDVVEVDLADGGIAHFAVTAVETYPKSEFPAEQVYGTTSGGTSLQLVTCGGDFDSDARSYVSNVVAFTSLVGITPPG